MKILAQLRMFNKRVFVEAVLSLAFLLNLLTVKSLKAQSTDPTTLPRIQATQIEWLGAFKFPSGNIGSSRFGYGGEAIGYHKDSQGRETLFSQGHVWYPGLVAQVLIPTLSTSRNADNLPRATLLQTFKDITDGRLTANAGDRLGTILSWNGKLIVSSWEFYDGSGDQQNFIGASSLDLNVTNDFQGFFPPSGINPGALGKYASIIPSEWHSLLGGPALSGAGSISIISRTNSGPGASVYSPNDVGTKNPVPLTEVIGYPLSNPVKFGSEVGGCSSQNNVWNCTSWISAVAFPPGSRSILFFGTHGTGPVCYKNDGPVGCQGTGGYNAPPYRTQIWAYDANDALAVKRGEKAASSVQPYALFTPTFSYRNGVEFANGSFDPVTNRLFLVETNGEDPIVHVLKFNTGSVGNSMPPSPPQNLRVVP